MLRGKEAGRDFVAFDYSYETHTNTSKGRSTTTHTFAVCVVPLPVPLGVVEVRPEGLMSRAADAMGVSSDLELESEEFNRRLPGARPQLQTGQRRAAPPVAAPMALPRLAGAGSARWIRSRRLG